MTEAEGFNTSTAFYADVDSFEDNFGFSEIDGTQGVEQSSVNVVGYLNLDNLLDGNNNGEDNNEFLNFGATDKPDVGNNMDNQILAAQRDLSQPNALPSCCSRPCTVTPSNISLGFHTSSPMQYGAPPDGEPS